MAPHRQKMTTRILIGHVLDKLRELPDESVHCVVTSPPYYGLRSYGTEPQVWPDGWSGDLGLEPTLDLYLDHMVEIMREVRRVMRKDATCWLNIGDSYAGSSGSGGHNPKQDRNAGSFHNGKRGTAAGIKPKDLMLIPWRLAIRLQEDGWYVRSAICWTKKSPMPESCTDRPTSAWEPVLLLTKAAKYFYDAEAVREESETDNREYFRGAGSYTNGNSFNNSADKPASGRGHVAGTGKRNLRNVWHLGPEPFAEAHFATFPTEIPRICIKAGTSEKGVCGACGAPVCRVVRKDFVSTRGNSVKAGPSGKGLQTTVGWRGDEGCGVTETETIGWQASCSCDAGAPVPGVVLDPFFGAGTTGLVADQLQRDCIGIELNPEYAAMAERRIRGDGELFADIL
jgi:DNA modification methylase